MDGGFQAEHGGGHEGGFRIRRNLKSKLKHLFVYSCQFRFGELRKGSICFLDSDPQDSNSALLLD